MLIALIVFITLFILCFINYFVDYLCHVKNTLQRYHIGRYDNNAEWKKKVENRAKKWLKHTPTVKITDNSRYVLLDLVNGKYRSKAIQSWQNASLIIGLSEYSETNKREIERYFDSIIDCNGNWKNDIKKVDVCMLSYSVLKNADDKDRIKPAMDYAIEVIKDNLTADEYITYSGGKNAKTLYVDTIGLVCPFLTLYAKTYHRKEYEELAYRQIELYHRYAMFGDSELPNHAFDIDNKLPLGVYGWGRGTAWYIIGLIDSYENAENERIKEALRDLLLSALESYRSFQRSDGGFGHILQLEFGYDSSATATLAWSYAKGAQIFNKEEYTDVSRHCIDKLKTVTRINGAIDWCQGDTKDIGVFAQTYDIMPFAQGMTLRAIAILNEGS